MTIKEMIPDLILVIESDMISLIRMKLITSQMMNHIRMNTVLFLFIYQFIIDSMDVQSLLTQSMMTNKQMNTLSLVDHRFIRIMMVLT